MKIDISTILLVIICVIPGLFALRSRDSVCPRTLGDQGASQELGELVALGISTHGVIFCFAIVVVSLWSWLFASSPLRLFTILDAWSFHGWALDHPIEATLYCVLYIFLSFAVSHWLGFVYGIWRLRSPVTNAIFKKSQVLKRYGVQGLLGQRPIVYETLNPNGRGSDGEANLVFVEIELKNELGFYAGQLSHFAILKDEEPHKPIYIISAFFKLRRADSYEPVHADGVLLDLAETVVVRVTETPPNQSLVNSASRSSDVPAAEFWAFCSA